MLSYSVSQTKWRITTEAENSARGSAFVLLWRLSAADLQANLHNRPSFAQVGRLNISDITFEYISSAFGRHHDPRCPQRLPAPTLLRRFSSRSARNGLRSAIRAHAIFCPSCFFFHRAQHSKPAHGE